MSVEDDGRNLVRVLVAQAEGSAPREAGAVMLVWADGFSGTIGGGALEFSAIAAAREMLGRGDWYRELRSLPLGPALGQCCGGMVRLLFETFSPSPRSCGERVEVRGGHKLPSQPGLVGIEFDAAPHPNPLPLEEGGEGIVRGAGLIVRPVVSSIEPVVVSDRTHTADWPLPVLRAVRQMLSGERPRETLLIAGTKGAPAYVIEPQATPPRALYLYGAGHVGRAVVRALEGLPFAVTWIDVAADRYPALIPVNAVRCLSTDPAGIAASATPDALHLVMTYSHALDLAITHSVLARSFAWAGLIGSHTKRARFEKRLREAGIPEAALARLVCPIGIGGIRGKEPAVIAISVAAQLAAWASEQPVAGAANIESAG